MERIKGLLKRRSGEARATVDSISEMEVVSDPENTPEVSPNHQQNQTIDNNDSNTYALMMEKIEQLTNEKYSLEDTLTDVQSELERTKQESLDFRSKCDDLEKSLELEKRRFRWQQKFYEQRIQQLTGLPTAGSGRIEAATPTPTDERRMSNGSVGNEETSRLRRCQSIEDLLDCNAFYEDTIKALVRYQETQNRDMNDLKKSYEDKLKNLSLEHEQGVTEILECSNFQMQKLTQENEALIRDLLTGCEGLFDELKIEFNEQARNNVELKTSSGTNIIAQFRALPMPVKGVVIAGITVISIATAGWASWGFIIWVWPRLLAFAEMQAVNPETHIMTLLAFLNSVPFQAFIRSWEDGKSLGECLKSFANTEFLSTAIRMAPELFTQFKKFPRPVAK